MSLQDEIMSFDLPVCDSYDTFEPHIRLSKSAEIPLITLGYHNLLSKARDKLASIANLPGIHDILQVVYPYQIDKEYEDYSSKNLELREVLTENKQLFSPLPKNVLHIGDKSSFKDLSSKKVDIIAPDVKKIQAELKKAGSTDLLFITGFDDPVITLTVGNISNANRLCLRLSDYCMTRTTMALVAFLQNRYQNVKLYRPLISSPFQGRATIYVVATKLNTHKVPPVLTTLMSKLVSSYEKHHVIDAFLNFDVPSVCKEALFEANTRMIARDIKSINELVNFVKDKNFEGTMMSFFRNRHEMLSKQWNEHVFS